MIEPRGSSILETSGLECAKIISIGPFMFGVLEVSEPVSC